MLSPWRVPLVPASWFPQPILVRDALLIQLPSGLPFELRLASRSHDLLIAQPPAFCSLSDSKQALQGPSRQQLEIVRNHKVDKAQTQ